MLTEPDSKIMNFPYELICKLCNLFIELCKRLKKHAYNFIEDPLKSQRLKR